MKTLSKILIVSLALVFFNCGKTEKKASPEKAADVSVSQETQKEVAAVVEDAPEKTLAEKMESGKQVYMKTCFACHQAEGQGIPNAFPPLANSDYLNADVDRAIDVVLNGKSGEITVNGVVYNSAMAKQAISNEEIADVLTYVYNSWENNETNVSKAQVDQIKNAH